MWPYIIMAAASIASGVSASNTAKQNARNNTTATAFNSRMQLEAGIINANAITAAAKANNMVTSALAKLGADDTWDIANYNADLRMLVGDYNAQLLEREAFDIWEAAELDVTQVDNQGKRLAGNILASYGASGAQINDTDSVADALIDAKTQVELEKFVIRHGADIRANKVINEAARNRWDGYVAAKQIIFEGGKSAVGQLANAAARIVGNTVQGQIDATTTYENARRGSLSNTMSGWATTARFNAEASQAMANGLYTGASQMASGAVSKAGTGTGTTGTTDTNVKPAGSYNSFNSTNNGSLITTQGSYSGSLLTD